MKNKNLFRNRDIYFFGAIQIIILILLGKSFLSNPNTSNLVQQGVILVVMITPIAILFYLNKVRKLNNEMQEFHEKHNKENK